MRLATFQGEKDLPSLVDRLYRFRRPTAAAKESARAALLAANPHLRDLKQVPAGFVIVVPEVPRLEVAEDTIPADDAVDEMLGEVRRAIGAIREAARASVQHEAEEARTTTELLGNFPVEALKRSDPVLAERLSHIAENAQAGVEEARTLQVDQEQALNQLEKDLQAFSRRPT